MRTIALATTGSKRRVRAIVFGSWAVHRAVPVHGNEQADDEDWAISHVPTGMSLSNLAHGLDIDDATTIAEALHDSGMLAGVKVKSKAIDKEDGFVIMAIVGAALTGHYREAGRRTARP